MKFGISLLALGALASGAAHAQEPQRFERPYWTDKPVIEAVGRAQIEVAANRASFSASFTDTAETPNAATSKVAERARLAAAAVRQRAGKDARIVSNVFVSPIYDTYRDKDGNVQEYDTPDRIRSYAATASLQVTVLDVAKAADARAAVLAARPTETETLSYSLDLTSDIQRQAFAAAAADAAARAKAAAAATGSVLGGLMVLQEGQGPCLGQWYAVSGLDGRGAFALSAAPPPAPDQGITVTGSARGQKLTITAQELEALTLPSDPAPQRVEARVCAVYAVGR